MTASALPSLFFTDELPRLYPTIFMYGIAGTGKTHSLRTLAHLNPIILATEAGNTKGMSTLGDLHFATILLRNLAELQGAIAELKSRGKPGELRYGQAGPFGAAALDSASGLGAFLEAAVKKLKGWEMIWDTTKGGGKDPRSAYPYISEKGRQVVMQLMDLPVPLVITCREQIMTEGEGQNARSYAVPELPGQKLPKELPGWPEATLRMRSVNNHRVFVTQNEGEVIARMRLKGGMKCPKYIKPDLGAVIRLLQGEDTALEDLKIEVAPRQTPQQLRAEQVRKEREQRQPPPPLK